MKFNDIKDLYEFIFKVEGKYIKLKNREIFTFKDELSLNFFKMSYTSLLKNFVYPIILFALLYLFCEAIKERYVSIYTSYAAKTTIRVHEGDSAVWLQENYDDTHWGLQLPKAPYFAWMRMRINLDSNQVAGRMLGLGLWAYTGSYDLYWDGVHIGSNGIPGIGSEEVPGQIDKIFSIPDSLLTVGQHLIAMRASQQFSKSLSTKPYVIIEEYEAQIKYLIIVAAFIHILTGVFLIISIYYFFIYFKSYRQIVFFIFAIICLLLFAGSFLHYFKFYYKYPYPFHLIRRISLEAIIMFLGISLSAYFLFLYKIKQSRIFLTVIAIVFAVSFLAFNPNGINQKSYLLYKEVVLISLMITIWALVKAKEYSRSSLYSLIAPFTILFFLELYFFNLMMYISFFIFIIFNLYTLSKTMGVQKKEREKYLIESNRLKLELLKKNIQPHFIMNTLASLISWVEEAPIIAVKFIEALAAEFRILVDIAEQDKIPVAKEIKLCESHLKVMSYRHEVDYQLKCIDLDPSLTIPPAIFLTLLENGITHNESEMNKIIFELQLEKSFDGMTYRFFSPSIVEYDDEPVKDGTGMKYIKARLRETFADAWSIESFKKNNGWEIKINLLR